MTSSALLSAFVLGLFSAPHCATMCGSVAGALLMAGRPSHLIASSAGGVDHRNMALVSDAAVYGVAKIVGYMALGLLLGTGGYVLGSSFRSGPVLLNTVAALMLVVLGLYVAGWWRGMTRFEQAAYRLWQPWLRKLQGLALTHTRNKLLAGFAWGMLPCGMVYSALALAMASASPLLGSSIMLAFGLGTLPFVLLSGALLQTLLPLLKKPWLRQCCGVAMIAMGLIKLGTIL